MAYCHVSLLPPTLLFSHALRIISFLVVVLPANPLWFNYPGFKQGNVKMEGDAYIQSSEIQVTVNGIGIPGNYSVGRVTTSKPLHLWDMSSGKLTDFRTKFSFIIFSENRIYGDGLAFFLADPNLPLLQEFEEGGGLGLVDGDQVLNSTKYSFVAVEFDTYSNPWDPSGTHAGININSVKSKRTQAWSADISKMKVYSCSVQYNSSTQCLSVFFTGYREDGKPMTQYLSYKVDLRDYLPEWVIFGFSAATGDLFEVHTLLSWTFRSSLDSNKTVSSETPEPPMATPPISHPNLSNKSNIGFWVGLGIGISVAVIFFGLVCLILRKRIEGKEKESIFDLNMDDEFQKGTGPNKFCYNDLVRATNNFAEAEKLGQGGFGAVYKGYLKNLNSYVAIKRISRDSKQGIKEYATEVKIISKLRHRNLVQLIGWCHKKNDLLLIYEFMPNRSLDSHLYHGKSFLTWPVRYNIALGLASALLYLQEEWEQCVLHRDIKPSNIMLDSCFNAKLGDFGLARLVDHEKGSQTTLVAGTMGYIAPEYVTTGKANKESDIYSFGVVMLEIASGRKAIDLKAKEGEIAIVEWIWGIYELGKLLEAADQKLCGAFDEQQMERLLIVGLWCAHPDHSFRPSMRQVIQVLNAEVGLPFLPKQLPVPLPTFNPPTLQSVFSSVSFSRGAIC